MLRAGMLGIDNLFSQNTQVEQGMKLAKLYAKTISANLFSKVKQAFQPAYAHVLA